MNQLQSKKMSWRDNCHNNKRLSQLVSCITARKQLA